MRVGSRVKHIFTTLPFTGTNSNSKRPLRSRSLSSSRWKEKDTTTTITDEYDNGAHISEDENASDADSLYDDDDYDDSNSSSKPRTVRIISWQLGDLTQTQTPGRCRWTLEQERELQLAQQELARCQKAWSSEQEVWLKQINALNNEKEAHEDFLNLRAKQQDDERIHFRKAWIRQRSEGDPPTADIEAESGDDGNNSEALRRSQSQSQSMRRFRRLRRGS